MHGIIGGMCLSPDKNFLYVTTFSLEGAGHIDLGLDFARPPYVISNEVRVQILDIKTLFSSIPCTPIERHLDEKVYEIYYRFSPSVSQDYVAATGLFNSFVYVFDRTYDKCISTLGHSSIVNVVAFNPRDQGMLVTGNKDNTLKIWKSKEAMRNVAQTMNLMNLYFS